MKTEPIDDAKDPTGGPAFPRARRRWDSTANAWFIETEGGMSQRDWFAGQALPIAAKGSSRTAEAIAKRAYYIADAMLAEREKGTQ